MRYPNVFSKLKPHSLFLDIDRRLALAVQVADIKCFRAHSTHHYMTGEDTGKISTGKVGFSTKVKPTVKVSSLAYHMHWKWKPRNSLWLCVF